MKTKIETSSYYPSRFIPSSLSHSSCLYLSLSLCGRNVGVDVGEVSLQGRRASTDPTGRIVNRDQPRDSRATLIDTSKRFSIGQPSNFVAIEWKKKEKTRLVCQLNLDAVANCIIKAASGKRSSISQCFRHVILVQRTLLPKWRVITRIRCFGYWTSCFYI